MTTSNELPARTWKLISIVFGVLFVAVSVYAIQVTMERELAQDEASYFTSWLGACEQDLVECQEAQE